MLKLYTCKEFDGHWPVGSAAVVIAQSKNEAADMLEAKLESIGLKQRIDAGTMIEVLMMKQAIVLCDGNY